jgi:hypothetical protein
VRSIGLSLSLVAALAVAVSVAEDESTSSDSGFKKAQKYAASRRPPKQPFIPDPDDIARMRADVYQNPIGKPDIEGFDIPQEKAAEVVKFFRDAEIDHNPYGDTYELGTIRFHMKGGACFDTAGTGSHLANSSRVHITELDTSQRRPITAKTRP